MKTGKGSAIKLGVTGGIGSGKTSVCRVFSVLGIPVFSADTVAREVMDIDTGIILRINTIVGKNLYSDGSLDRNELAKLIFNNKKLLEKVNSLVHPVVFSRFREWEKKQLTPYVIMEAAILFESGGSEVVDRIITVVAPIEERVGRVIHRSDLTREQVMERMRNQMSDSDRIKHSDYVIQNSENDMIIPSVLRIHEDILKMVNSRV
ncbi:MAG: dephospho-CoA kinase [Bacteroidetes bacterium GWE2_41_25]|nr:MAG: dephospho-CoA kinase [Bacteroidetes bacterium GWA2_40_15]OFX83885.1 MAG: dephospho-CoA kinase [Bacteroidetes bacterium GWC2_40_22]OFX99018.1 MAG: dephospho-CoA kinase [Bacteroidetes bacterium GWE2_41_25]OFY58491.1 MAG: dephospho-CoA kinase [Bacteroidetes bacterium GWF2_41_9]HBH83670.1 dephospho-CoA kinase [Bacteroidales bacterium]